MKNTLNMIDRIVLVDNCNFIDFPIGGQLTFAKQLLETFSDNILLVGITTNKNQKIGNWTKIEIDGCSFDYLPVLYRKNTTDKPFIPARIQWTLALLWNLKSVKKSKIRVFLTQDINSLYPVNKIKDCIKIHVSAGLNNPFVQTRYRWSKVFKNIFHKFWTKQLSKATYIFAAADDETIIKFIKHSPYLGGKPIHKLPTRFNEKIFYPQEKHECRKKLNIKISSKVIVTSGRISKGKGWDLLLDSFEIVHSKYPDSYFIYLGDGEDRANLEDEIKRKNINNFLLKGNVSPEILSTYLSASDLFVMGSYMEGWSTSIVEALACGKNIVTTKVSSAEEMVKDELNGFVIKERSAQEFAKKIIDSFILIDPNPISINIVESFKLSKLKSEFFKIWQS